MLAGRGIGPFAGGTLRRLPGAARTSSGPAYCGRRRPASTALAPAVGEIVTAHRLGLAREAVRQFGAIAASRGLPFADALDRIAVEHLRPADSRRRSRPSARTCAAFARKQLIEQGGVRPCRLSCFNNRSAEGAIAPAARRHLEHAGLAAVGIDDGPNAEALQERTLRDAFGELLDRNARLHMTDIGLAEHQLVEGNVARRRQGDLLDSLRHLDSPRRAAESLSRLPTRRGNRPRPLTLVPATADRSSGHFTPPRHRRRRARQPGDRFRNSKRDKSATLLACEAARTMARLSSRSTSSHEPI